MKQIFFLTLDNMSVYGVTMFFITVGQEILATKKVANCKKTPKIRQYFLVAKLCGGKAVLIARAPSVHQVQRIFQESRTLAPRDTTAATQKYTWCVEKGGTKTLPENAKKATSQPT